jgi:hypothetical protein
VKGKMLMVTAIQMILEQGRYTEPEARDETEDHWLTAGEIRIFKSQKRMQAPTVCRRLLICFRIETPDRGRNHSKRQGSG